MNTSIFSGNLTRDPDFRITQGEKQTAICRFSVAVTDGYGDKARTSYPSVVVFGKLAETCNQYLKKGSKVLVQSRIQTGSYEKEGRTIYTTDFVATSVEFLSRKPDGNSANGQQSAPASKAPESEDGFGLMDLQDDDIPF